MPRSKKSKCTREVPITSTKRTRPPTNTGSCNSGKIYIINHHTASIVLPRAPKGNVSLPPLNLKPGVPNLIDAEEWAIKKKNTVVGYYIDKGILVEVKRVLPNQNIGTFSYTSDLKVPEHLASDEEMEGKEGIGKASVIKKEIGTVLI